MKTICPQDLTTTLNALMASDALKSQKNGKLQII